jgi:hypothetical protein
MRSANIWTILAACALVWAAPAPAQDTDTQSVQRVTVREQKLLISTGGEFTVTTNLVKLPFDIVASTNLTYRVGEGKERPLRDGQVLDREGMILNPDGTTHPVYDHVTMSRNQILVLRDGDYSTLGGTLKLGDGSVVSDDCYIKYPTGERIRLQDGQVFRLSGATVAAKDTVTLLNGRVVVQKEGSSFPVARGSFIMMNEGTRVFGDGYLVRSDGSRQNLVEGQTLQVEGIVVRR